MHMCHFAVHLKLAHTQRKKYNKARIINHFQDKIGISDH